MKCPEIKLLKECSYETVNIELKIRLENGVILYVDSSKRYAEGSDGKRYCPVCRNIRGLSPQSDNLEVLGWSPEISGEMILEA